MKSEEELEKLALEYGIANMCDSMPRLIEALEARLEKAEELNRVYESALSFYADEKNWFNDDSSNFRLEINPEDGQEFRRPKAIYIGGLKARLALAAKTQKE